MKRDTTLRFLYFCTSFISDGLIFTLQSLIPLCVKIKEVLNAIFSPVFHDVTISELFEWDDFKEDGQPVKEFFEEKTQYPR